MRRIQPDIWLMRRARPMATATDPGEVSPSSQSRIDSAPTDTIRAVFSAVRVQVRVKTVRIRSWKERVCRATPSRAKWSSRAAWAKSFTAWMLV